MSGGATARVPMLAVAISGSPRSPSRSKTLAELMLAALAARGYETRVVDLAVLPADALLARRESPEIDEAIAAVGEARIVPIMKSAITCCLTRMSALQRWQ